MIIKSDNKLKTTIALIVLVVFYLFDRFIKQAFLLAPEIMAQKIAWLPFANEVYFNTGIIFSWSLPAALIILVSIFLLLLVVLFLLRNIGSQKSWIKFFGWGLIFIGGFSNLWDRLTLGYVVDWWQMPWGAVINLADIYVFVGVIYLLFIVGKDQQKFA